MLNSFQFIKEAAPKVRNPRNPLLILFHLLGSDIRASKRVTLKSRIPGLWRLALDPTIQPATKAKILQHYKKVEPKAYLEFVQKFPDTFKTIMKSTGAENVKLPTNARMILDRLGLTAANASELKPSPYKLIQNGRIISTAEAAKRKALAEAAKRRAAVTAAEKIREQNKAMLLYYQKKKQQQILKAGIEEEKRQAVGAPNFWQRYYKKVTGLLPVILGKFPLIDGIPGDSFYIPKTNKQIRSLILWPAIKEDAKHAVPYVAGAAVPASVVGLPILFQAIDNVKENRLIEKLFYSQPGYADWADRYSALYRKLDNDNLSSLERKKIAAQVKAMRDLRKAFFLKQRAIKALKVYQAYIAKRKQLEEQALRSFRLSPKYKKFIADIKAKYGSLIAGMVASKLQGSLIHYIENPQDREKLVNRVRRYALMEKPSAEWQKVLDERAKAKLELEKKWWEQEERQSEIDELNNAEATGSKFETGYAALAKPGVKRPRAGFSARLLAAMLRRNTEVDAKTKLAALKQLASNDKDLYNLILRADPNLVKDLTGQRVTHLPKQNNRIISTAEAAKRKAAQQAAAQSPSLQPMPQAAKQNTYVSPVTTQVPPVQSTATPKATPQTTTPPAAPAATTEQTSQTNVPPATPAPVTEAQQTDTTPQQTTDTTSATDTTLQLTPPPSNPAKPNDYRWLYAGAGGLGGLGIGTTIALATRKKKEKTKDTLKRVLQYGIPISAVMSIAGYYSPDIMNTFKGEA